MTFLGSMFSQGTKDIKKINREDSKHIRKQLNTSKICDECLNDYSHQTVDGRMICDVCKKEESRQSNE